MSDIHKKSKSLERLIKKIKGELDGYKDIGEKNRKTFLEFRDKAYSLGDLSDSRVYSYLIRLWKITDWIEKPLIEFSKEDIEKLVGKVNQNGYSEWTKHDYKTVIKKFFQVMEGYGWNSDDFPDKADWIKPYIRKNKRKKLRREDILSQDEALSIISETRNKRDKALIHLLWEGGLRCGELLNMRIKHIELEEGDNHAIIPESGKTGTRKILVISSVPALREWLNVHPEKDNREAWLWQKLNDSGERVSYQILRKLLRKCAKRAGVEKPVNPHNFRHSRVTFCLKYMTDAEARKFFGWAKDSDALAMYDHLIDRDADDAVRRMYGRDEKKLEKPKGLKVCKICGYENTAEKSHCQSCGSKLFESEYPPWIESLINKKMEELKKEIKT